MIMDKTIDLSKYFWEHSIKFGWKETVDEICEEVMAIAALEEMRVPHIPPTDEELLAFLDEKSNFDEKEYF